MARERQWQWILPVLLMTTTTTAARECEADKCADMTGPACDRLQPFTVNDKEVVQVYARQPQIPGGTATRDNCVVEIRAEENRRLRLYITDMAIDDCGINVLIYDGDHMASPIRRLDCDTKPGIIYDSRTEIVKISLTKQSTSALGYQFSISVTTDQGPDLPFEKTMSNYNAGVISAGAIVGIAVAGGLIFVALVAIAIYCIVKQRKKNLDAEKAQPAESTVYTSGSSKVLFPTKKERFSHDVSSNDSHNNSYSSADGHNNYVNMNPDPKGRQTKRARGIDNRAYASSDDGTHDRSRDSTGSDDISAGQVNGSFDSTSDAPSGRRYSKNQENGNAGGSISRSARRGSARSKSRKRKDSAGDDKKNGPPRDRSRGRSSSGHRSGHRDSGRRSRSHGERGGSQRRSRSRSPHSQSSNHSAFDREGHNRMYDISSISKRSRESSNSSTSSRDSGDERTVSYDPSGRRRRDRGHYNKALEVEQDQYGSQV